MRVYYNKLLERAIKTNIRSLPLVLPHHFVLKFFFFYWQKSGNMIFASKQKHGKINKCTTAVHIQYTQH